MDYLLAGSGCRTQLLVIDVRVNFAPLQLAVLAFLLKLVCTSAVCEPKLKEAMGHVCTKTWNKTNLR